VPHRGEVRRGTVGWHHRWRWRCGSLVLEDVRHQPVEQPERLGAGAAGLKKLYHNKGFERPKSARR